MSNVLITDDYRELNRRLHAETAFGERGHKWTEHVATLLAEGGYVNVLDYGCGKGKLKEAFGGMPGIREYDPAVAGKDDDPEPSELVVCTDVLEHIEPECLDAVLKHIKSKTIKQLFIVISTRPAKKTLADGRNAHLIVEDGDWWCKKLEEYFKVDSWGSFADECTGLLSPVIELGKISGKSAVPDDLRYEQAKVNMPKVRDRIRGRQPVKVGHVILCAYGPTLNDTWTTINAERDAFPGAVVVSVSGAHDFLIERGIVPDYHVEVDPRIHKADFTRNSHPDVHYLIGSCCHPTLVDNLVDNERAITLFHIYNSDRDLQIINELEPDTVLLAGGGSVGLRAINLLFGMGYRSFSLRGMDSSFSEIHGQHAAVHSGKVQNEVSVRCGGRWFKSSMIMVAYARFFFSNWKNLDQICKLGGEEPINESGDNVVFVLHGDSLLSAMGEEMMREARLVT